MNTIHLNEHDANQGAQSSGEFLGMTGNSGWYLLGSGGATIMMVVFLWGILGVSLLLCLFVGIILCLGSVAYVFTLKNNKPAHYDTDFFESAIVEAGILDLSFGPRSRRLVNPFTDAGNGAEPTSVFSRKTKAQTRPPVAGRRSRPAVTPTIEKAEASTKSDTRAEVPENWVTRRDYDVLQEKLSTTEEVLEEVLADLTEE